MGPGLELYLRAVKYLVEHVKGSVIYPAHVVDAHLNTYAHVICLLPTGHDYDFYFYYDKDDEPFIDVFKIGTSVKRCLDLKSFKDFIAKEFPASGPADVVAPAFQQLAEVLSCVSKNLNPVSFDLSGFRGDLYKSYYEGYSKPLLELPAMVASGYLGLCFVMLSKATDPKGVERLFPSLLLVDFELHADSSDICKLSYCFQPTMSPYSATVLYADDIVNLSGFMGDYPYFVESHLCDAKRYAVR